MNGSARDLRAGADLPVSKSRRIYLNESPRTNECPNLGVEVMTFGPLA